MNEERHCITTCMLFMENANDLNAHEVISRIILCFITLVHTGS